jgi:hypothetical protein
MQQQMGMDDFRYHIRLICNGLTAAALCFAAALLAIACSLERWGFVEKAEIRQLAFIYEMGFSLVPVLLFSQLFAVETDEGIFRWILALPFRRWQWLLGRWLTGMALLGAVYFGSLLVVDLWVMPIPWGSFAYEIGVPSLWLGHLALFTSILLRSSLAGLGVGMAYWCMESFSRGLITGRWYLFRAAALWGEPIDGNRLLFLSLSLLLLCVGLMLVRPAYYSRA